MFLHLVKVEQRLWVEVLFLLEIDLRTKLTDLCPTWSQLEPNLAPTWPNLAQVETKMKPRRSQVGLQVGLSEQFKTKMTEARPDELFTSPQGCWALHSGQLFRSYSALNGCKFGQVGLIFGQVRLNSASGGIGGILVPS